MNKLVTEMRPTVFQMNEGTRIKCASLKLSTNALKYIFPIREQKILFKRPGREGQFVNSRVTIKLEDLREQIELMEQKKKIEIIDPQILDQSSPRKDLEGDKTVPKENKSKEPEQKTETTPKKAQNSKAVSTPQSGKRNQTEEKHIKENIVKYVFSGQYNDIFKTEDL